MSEASYKTTMFGLHWWLIYDLYIHKLVHIVLVMYTQVSNCQPTKCTGISDEINKTLNMLSLLFSRTKCHLHAIDYYFVYTKSNMILVCLYRQRTKLTPLTSRYTMIVHFYISTRLPDTSIKIRPVKIDTTVLFHYTHLMLKIYMY